MNQQNNIQEIDLLSLLNKLLKERVLLIKMTSAFLVVGLIISLLLPTKFSAGSTFVPMLSSDSKSSGLSGLAS
ncbi:MAG: Wzz/FepE/Etk N-terminal domain-containing protein [Cytophagales bacterium]|nr:Wzz/FepE/Etk N-terminal domain-containing protein [Cytophagales bacterium]